MHEALLPPSKRGQDGDIGTIAPLMQQINEKTEKNICAKVDVRNVEKFEIYFVFQTVRLRQLSTQ